MPGPATARLVETQSKEVLKRADLMRIERQLSAIANPLSQFPQSVELSYKLEVCSAAPANEFSSKWLASRNLDVAASVDSDLVREALVECMNLIEREESPGAAGDHQRHQNLDLVYWLLRWTQNDIAAKAFEEDPIIPALRHGLYRAAALFTWHHTVPQSTKEWMNGKAAFNPKGLLGGIAEQAGLF